MLDGLLHLFSPRPAGEVIRDLLDIFIVTYVIYRALLLLRGTRAIQMGVGLGIVFLVYLGAKAIQLATLLHLLSWLLSSIILIVVVVFQNDIRRALIRMGGQAWLIGGREQQSRVIDEVVAAATELARHRMGAIIAFEQDANVLEFVKSEGVALDAAVTRELLVSLFVPESVNKLHDGAVLIRDLKIARAGVFFPMPETKILDSSLGSRHRAALGITEETDAVVVVVSEERGTISFCFSGNIVSNLDGQSLRHALLGLFGRSSRKKRLSRKPPVTAPPRPPHLSRPDVAARTPSPASVAVPPAPLSTRSPAAGKMLATSTPMRSATDTPVVVDRRMASTDVSSTTAPPGTAMPQASRAGSFVSATSATSPSAGPPSTRAGSESTEPPPGDES